MPKQETRDVFVQGGHICAFNTFGGIMSSPEWDAVVKPMCKDEIDWLHGMVAVINALGWGVWRIERIDPGKGIVIRIYNSYEGIGYRRMYPKSDEAQLSFLAMGAVQSGQLDPPRSSAWQCGQKMFTTVSNGISCSDSTAGLP